MLLVIILLSETATSIMRRRGTEAVDEATRRWPLVYRRLAVVEPDNDDRCATDGRRNNSVRRSSSISVNGCRMSGRASTERLNRFKVERGKNSLWYYRYTQTTNNCVILLDQEMVPFQ